MTTKEHLTEAEAYARPLSVEKTATCTEEQVSLAVMMGDEGAAMRALVYHCTAAIVGAIRAHANSSR